METIIDVLVSGIAVGSVLFIIGISTIIFTVNNFYKFLGWYYRKRRELKYNLKIRRAQK